MSLICERIDSGLLEAPVPCCSPESCLSHFPDTVDIGLVGAKAKVEFTSSDLADSVKTDCTALTVSGFDFLSFLGLTSSAPSVSWSVFGSEVAEFVHLCVYV